MCLFGNNNQCGLVLRTSFRLTSRNLVSSTSVSKETAKGFELLRSNIKNKKKLATLRIHGPDSKGIVAHASNLLDQYGCDIVTSEQWTDRYEKRFFQRIQFDYREMTKKASSSSSNVREDKSSSTSTDDNVIMKALQNELEHELSTQLLRPRNLNADWNWRTKPYRVAVMVSKYDHCLWEVLLRYKAGELINCEIPVVLSNHEKLRNIAEGIFGIPYHFFDMSSSDKPSIKESQEAKQLDLLLNQYNVDTIVLARYMQVLSLKFLQTFPSNQIINIHHSFLPAFSGGRPYHRAHERGVKLLGATAHYTTTDLDEGPIIEQDVISTSHRDDTIHKLITKGRIIERNVLIKALQAHLDDRIIVYRNKCVVFHD